MGDEAAVGGGSGGSDRNHESLLEQNKRVLSIIELDGLKARPGGTDESSPAIYRRVRDHMGPRPGGTPEYRCAINSKDTVLQSRYRVSLEN